MKIKVLNIEYSAFAGLASGKSSVHLKGTVIDLDSHSINHILSTPYFPRR